MLMSRPRLGLRAVNTELMRLVVCLCTAVTRLKDGPLSRATIGSFQAPHHWLPLSGPDIALLARGLLSCSSTTPALLHLSPSWVS